MQDTVLTLVVGLGAGVVGSLLSTGFQIRHERESALRQRMLQAAIDFAANAHEAVDALRSVKGERLLAAGARTRAVAVGQFVPHPTQGISTALAHELCDALIRGEAGIRVLFGPDSHTASAAQRVWQRLFDDIEAEEGSIQAEMADTTGSEIAVEDAMGLREQIDAFSREARKDLRAWAIR